MADPISPEALQIAEKEIVVIFGKEIGEAATTDAHASLARHLLEVANGTAEDPAAQFVLLQTAGRQAVIADDIALALDILRVKVVKFPPDGTATELIQTGHDLWQKAEDAEKDDALRLRLQAAEKYLAAEPNASGLGKLAIEKRLESLALHGQSAGRHITKRTIPSYDPFFNLRKGKVIILLQAPREVADELVGFGFALGDNRDPKTGADTGLAWVFRKGTLDPEPMKGWCGAVSIRADRDNMIATAWHPRLTKKDLEEATDRPIFVIKASTTENAIRQAKALIP